MLLSNGSEAKVGSTYAPWEFFGDWKVIDADGTRGVVALETAIRGTCAHDRLLDLIENFVAYMERPGGLIKAVARNHQVLGVNAAIENLSGSGPPATSGSGSSGIPRAPGSACRCCGSPRRCCADFPGAWTFVMVTDRTELDVQLHGEFADAGAISRRPGCMPSDSAHLRELLAADHRYVFTLDPQVPPRQGRRGDADARALRPSRRHRHHRRGTPQPVRHPGAEHAPGSAQRLVHGVHRHAADRRRGADPPASSATTSASTTSATPSRTAPPSRCTTRTASPSCSSSTRTSPTSSTELLEEAELDEEAEGQLARRFGRQYTLITRPERLRTVAKDLVRHFVGRGFAGKAMYVGIDKAAAVRMYDFVREAWAEHLAELRAQHDALPELERPWLASRIELMETTDMAVVVSQGQNEIADARRQGARHPPASGADEHRRPRRELQGPRMTRCGWCSSAPCG